MQRLRELLAKVTAVFVLSEYPYKMFSRSTSESRSLISKQLTGFQIVRLLCELRISLLRFLQSLLVGYDVKTVYSYLGSKRFRF